ncbi:MAG TPA: DinB family protein [Armatimonadota bacterium]
MIEELKPVWKQFVETYDALNAVLEEIPDARLHWNPTPANPSAAAVAFHIARGNIAYANRMETGDSGERPTFYQDISRAALKAVIDESLDRVRTVFRDLPPKRLHAVCATDWEPLGPVVKGHQDALWFAMQIVRHTAYHVGQLNYISLMI